MKTFKFEKEKDNRWYIILPEWTGEKEELEMVCGADSMLDILAQGDYYVYVTISDKEFTGYNFILTLYKEDGGGGWYTLKGNIYEFDLWLCHVTKFIFDGSLPKVLYCC
jgi:hypothetical protein